MDPISRTANNKFLVLHFVTRDVYPEDVNGNGATEKRNDRIG